MLIEDCSLQSRVYQLYYCRVESEVERVEIILRSVRNVHRETERAARRKVRVCYVAGGDERAPYAYDGPNTGRLLREGRDV